MPIIKRFKAHVPIEIRDWEEEKVKVHLDPVTGFFEIEIPENVSSVTKTMERPDYIKITEIHSKGGWDRKTRKHSNPELLGRRVQAKDLDSVISHWKILMKTYSVWMQDNEAEKWISVVFGFNVRHVDGFHNAEDAPRSRRGAFGGYAGGRHGRMSFATQPAIEIASSIVWKIQGGFYTKSPQGNWVSEGSRDSDKTHRIKWTQQRWDFLQSVDVGLTKMICRMVEFFEDFEGNMDTAIESGGSMLQIQKADDQ